MKYTLVYDSRTEAGSDMYQGVNDYSTYLCTVDGIAVPLQPFAIATVVCKWLLRNSYTIYCTQADRVLIVATAQAGQGNSPN